MDRLNIAVLFGTKPNFESDAFKFFLLYLNKIQKTYEFYFPDVIDYPFKSKKKKKVNFETSHKTVKDFTQNSSIVADHIITIITNSFDNNYFFNAEQKTSIITTDVWNKYFSPPTLFEYLLHCIYTCLIYSQIKPKGQPPLTEKQKTIYIGSHKDTRGCIADFTRNKYDDRIDITLGYICDEHKQEILDFYGNDYLKEVQQITERNWIGKLDEQNSVAYNLRHIFKVNINRDSGFNKNWWDKIKDKFYEIPGSLIGEMLKIILIAFLTYLLIKIGILDNK